MKTVLALFATFIGTSWSFAAGPACNIKAQKAAQALAHFNGVPGNSVVSSYSQTDDFSVEVDQVQTYTLHAKDAEGACLIDQIHLASDISTSRDISEPKCNIEAMKIASDIAVINNLKASTVDSSYSSTYEFTVKIDNQQTYKILASKDGSCKFQDVLLISK